MLFHFCRHQVKQIILYCTFDFPRLLWNQGDSEYKFKTPDLIKTSYHYTIISTASRKNKNSKNFSLLPSVPDKIIKEQWWRNIPFSQTLSEDSLLWKLALEEATFVNCSIHQIISSHSCQLTAFKTGCMQSYQEEAVACERMIPKTRCP